MSCGHVLCSRLRDCARGNKCKGELWKPAFINDSCAVCHRSVNLHQNRELYNHKQGMLMTEYRKAKGEGDEERMRRLQRAMLQHTRLSRQDNFEVSLTREALPGNVQWPNAHDGVSGRH